MELSHLKYFLEVARTQHVTQSARNLCIVQPALTQAIHRLETEIGVPLFKNSGRNIKLTEYGQYFYEKLKPLYEQIENLPQELRDLAKGDVKKIKINVLAASSIVTSAVIMYKRLHPEVVFDLIQNESESAYDVCVNTYSKKNLKIDPKEQSCCFEEEIFLAAQCTNDNKKLDRISVQSLKDKKFIGLAGTKQLRSICNEFCENLGFSTSIAFESDNTNAVKDAVAAGIGVCFWPEYTWGKINKRKIKLMKIKDAPFKRNILISIQKNKTDNRVIEDFYKFLVAYLKRQFKLSCKL